MIMENDPAGVSDDHKERVRLKQFCARGGRENQMEKKEEMKKVEALLDQWFSEHKEEMTEELMEWVRHRSVSRADLAEPGAPFGRECRNMLDFALGRLQHFGFRTENYDGYCGAGFFGDGSDEVGILAHTDVVPEGDGWIFAPYEPVIKDGFMIGRGSDDDKSAAVLGLYAMRFFKETGAPIRKSIRLMLGCSEETGMQDYQHYIREMHGDLPPFGFVPDAEFPVCFAEKGGWNMDISIPAGKNIVSLTAGTVRNAIPDKAFLVLRDIPADKIRACFRGEDAFTVTEEPDGTVQLKAKGLGGHAASPEGTVNALVLLAKAVSVSPLASEYDLSGLSFIAKTFASPYGEGMGFSWEDKMTGKLTSNAGIAETLNGRIRVTIDVRFPISAEMERLTEEFRAYLRENDVEETYFDMEGAFYIDPKDERVVLLQEIYRDVTGDTAEPFSMGGGTYSRVVPNFITFGLGMPHPEPDFLPVGHGSCHAPDEVLHLESWYKAFRIYVLALAAL